MRTTQKSSEVEKMDEDKQLPSNPMESEMLPIYQVFRTAQFPAAKRERSQTIVRAAATLGRHT
jgi:hypothetical protein